MPAQQPSIILGKDGFSIPLEAITNTFGIFGLRGSGKSSLATVFAEGIVKAGQPICIIDPTGSAWGMKSSRDGKSPGLPIYVFGGEHADVPLEPTAGAVIADFLVEQRVPVILDLKLMRKHEQIRFVTDFAETLYHKNREPLMVMIDECPRFAPQTLPAGSPDGARCLGAIIDLATMARSRGIGVTLISQRPALLNTTLRTQLENLICLRTIGKHDRKALDEWVEAKGTMEQRNAMMRDLASLPVGTGYFWSPGWLDEFRRVQFRQRETYDSGRTPKLGEKLAQPRAFAEIDKDRLSKQILATVEKVKADDPKELRKQIAELNQTIIKLRSRPVPESVNPEPLIQAALSERIQAALSERNEHIAKHLAKLKTDVSTASQKHTEALDGLLALFEISLKVSEAFKPIRKPEKAPSQTEGYIAAIKNQPLAQTAIAVSANGNGLLSAGKRRIMTALAQRPGISARQVGLRAGISSKSGTFGTYMSYLRASGFIEGTSASLKATPAGLAALGTWDELPSGAELRRHWQNELGSGSGAARILDVLSTSYPRSLTAEEVGERAGISHKSGTFGTYMSKLRTLELITGTPKGLILSEELA